jgi:hypothetical protein
MNGLLAHCGADIVTRDMVFDIEPPEHTRSWKPVAYRDAVLTLHDTIDKVLGMQVVHEEFALNKKGTQMFHVARVEHGNEEAGLSIGLRQSYDKSLALGVVAGAQVFVCDNLCFTGSDFQIMRKNTTNVWDDFTALIRAQVRNSLGAFERMTVDIEALKAVPCSLRRGFATLGVLQGEGLLKPQQATVAYGDWAEPRHEEFADRNLWGLYNAITEGLKKGGAGSVIDRHIDVHHWFRNELGLN